MSKLETPMIREYWKQVGGTLIEEFQVVSTGPGRSRRLIDAVIIPDGDKEIRSWQDVSLEGKNIIAVQAKARRLGMYLMGQALFSKKLLEDHFQPQSVISVALCSKDDEVLRSLLEQYEGLKVVVLGRVD